ncbi:bifunctional PGK/TIM [bacterium MnTg02]|nr:bifunctional PGK/TIM [bacterium MnTg02]
MNLESLKTLDDVDVAGQRVLLRADLNVPMADGKVSDTTRLERIRPTLNVLASRGARIVIISHFGRPKGEARLDMSLAPVAAALGEVLARIPVRFASDCIGEEAASAINELSDGQAIVLENLRFHAGEEANDPEFARALSKLGDVYVNDAFSVAHRAHASIEALAHLLPAYAGPLMMGEIEALRSVLDHPEKPVAAVIGGAKVSSKIPVLTNLLAKVDVLIIGGGMANTFLYAGGMDVGKSLCEPDFVETVKQIAAEAGAQNCEILLPSDVVVAEDFRQGARWEILSVGGVPENGMILDVGPETIAELTKKVADCKTLLWNGPLGAFEIAPFGEGTFALARAAAERTKAGSLVTVAGGGDTVAALNAAGVTKDFSYVSMAGGAFLEWLEGRDLPGIAALSPPEAESAVAG